MSTLNFPDVNVWLALIWERHPHAAEAYNWFEAAREEQFWFCRFTQISVLRLLTTESVLGRDAQTLAGAWELWDRVRADDRIGCLPEPERLEHFFRTFSSAITRSPKVWADAYLLGFAAAAGLQLVTFDRALKTRGGPDVLLL